ncbi:MAG: arylformamidase [Phenylobacterium sp.]|jgi:arylformamidase
MKITATINGQDYQAHLADSKNIAIAVHFDGEQPNHFSVPVASAHAIEGGGFVGDTRRGGSCNVDQITMVPHCNGTHTECVGHIIDERLSVNQLLQDNLLATRLITVSPTLVSGPTDDYTPALDNGDKLIDKACLVEQLADINDEELAALVVRTLPNDAEKQSMSYDELHYPPFFSHDAIRYLNQRGVKHLLVDFPSLDRMHDEGNLSSHHLFWQVKPLSRTLDELVLSFKTITEMVYIGADISDGLYLLNLQIAPFELDAAPSRPMLIPLSPSLIPLKTNI